MNWIEFECMIMDWAEEDDHNDKKSLESFADHLHQHVEIALQDYADESEIYDYEPSY